MTPLRPSVPLPIRFSAHDRLQLEIKSELLCSSPTDERATWSTDIWFLLPQATGVAPGSYAPEDFYEDLRAYTRLKTPVVPLAELVRRDGHRSPLAALAVLASRAAGQRLTKPEKKLLIQECKLLSAVFKSQVRDWLSPQEKLAASERLERADELAGHLRQLVTTWRALRDDLYSKQIPKKCRYVLSYCDESLSIQLEQAALDQVLLLEESDRITPGAELLTALAREEQAHRSGKGWRTTLDADAPGEEYIDQARLIKKYVSSALHLHLRTARGDWLVRQGAFAVAAGIAMAWAVIAQLLMFVALDMQLRAGVSLGFMGSFMALAVGAYVLKDRIKANAAPALSRRLNTYLSDHRDDIYMPEHHKPVGRISERMTFETSRDLPAEVALLRKASARAHLLLVAEQDVLRYTRQVELRPREAVVGFPRLDGLSDILRLNVWRWIRTYSRARKQLPFVDPDGKVKVRKVDNLYFVDVLVRVTRVAPLPATHLAHFRLAMNRRGLVDVQEVGSVA